MSLKIAPSILAADLAATGREVKAADKAGADWMHLDVMDGHFVPNLTFGPGMVQALRGMTRKPLDVHLMISEPARYMASFAAAGADRITWHIECDDKPAAVMASLAGHKKVRKGIALKPATPLKRISSLLKSVDLVLVMSVEPGFGGQKFMAGMMPKIVELKRLRKDLGLKFLIEIDGGIDASTAAVAVEAGVDVLVAGTSVFGKTNYRKAIQALRG